MNTMATPKASRVFLLPFLFLLVGGLSSCSTTYTVGDLAGLGRRAPELSYHQLNEQLDGTYRITGFKLQIKEFKATDIHVRSDSTSFTDLATNRPEALPTGDVFAIEHTSPGWGALEGLGIGAAIGGLGGAGFGLLLGAGDCYPRSDNVCTNGALVFGVPSAVLGTIIGLIVGHTTEYQFAY